MAAISYDQTRLHQGGRRTMGIKHSVPVGNFSFHNGHGIDYINANITLNNTVVNLLVYYFLPSCNRFP